HDLYTCPMHPAVVSDKPGLCPICGMDLTRKNHQGKDIEFAEDLTKLLESPDETVVSSIKTIKAEYKDLSSNLEAQGIVTYDTRNIYSIPARISGRLEKVFLKYPFQRITKGQKIAEIYSPELITAQRELLYLLEHDAQDNELIQSAKTKLILLGFSEAQITSLIQRKEVLNTFSVHSPYDGYLIMENGQAPSISTTSVSNTTSGRGMNEMSSSASDNTSSSQSSTQINTILREGSYVSTGQTLFNVVNPSSLRIELNIAASQSATIKKGTTIHLVATDGKEIKATVDFIQPFFSEGEAFVKLRAYANKTEDLHIGQLVKAKLIGNTDESLWLPREAVLDLGLRQIVFIKEHNVLKPKKITVGTKAEGWTEIRQGITSSDEIAANAQYLVDSESFIKVD
ncbi:MAG TPA: efflux RND transporter periplasmic adaptor subunit, partial [Cyclobacteriaceae bacterium]